MIVRIQTEGQWELSASQVDQLNEIDNRLVHAIDQSDVASYESLLGEMLGYVRANGRPLPLDEIAESELILPPADATIDEVREMFAHEGVIKS